MALKGDGDTVEEVSAPRPGRRRSQTERSAQTRERVLAATIRLLREGGYSAASVQAIAREAGMSLGSLQHQFPTKAKLMTAVVEQLAARRIEAYRAEAERTADPMTRYRNALDTTWSLVRQPEFAATLEIMLARRSDPELWAESAGAFEVNDTLLREWVVGLGEAAGENPRAAEFRRSLSNTFMYGLALRLAVGLDPGEAEALVAYWKSLLEIAGRRPDLSAAILTPGKPPGGATGAGRDPD